MTRVADSSFLIALVDEDDPRRPQAKSWTADPDPIAIPTEVLGETLGVVHARRGFAAARALWDFLAGLPHVELWETSDAGATAEAFRKGKGKLSWVDAAVVATCRSHGFRPLCFDDDIVKAVGN